MELKEIATIVRDFATAAAVLIGGGWAVWKWGFEERLRKKKEVISPDGKLIASIVPLNEKNVVVTIEATWRNQGSFSIHLLNESSYVSVIEIHKSSNEGNFPVFSKNSIYKTDLFSGKYIMEPKTESLMHKHFILPKAKVFLFLWVIGFEERHFSDFDINEGFMVCSREIVVNTTLD